MENVAKSQIRYIKVPFDDKEQVKTLGGRWDAAAKCWFVPVGIDPMLFRDWWAYLECPFEEKDDARKLGARWDKSFKKWYVPTGVEFSNFEKWWPGWVTERMALPEREPEETRWHEVNGQLGGTYMFSFSEDYQKSGGTAKVFFGWRVDDNGDFDGEDLPTVAIKNFYSDDDSLDFTMFEREVDALRKLNNHPNIVSLIDYGFDPVDRTFFIVTEYVPFSLSELLSHVMGGSLSLLGEEVTPDDDDDDDDKTKRTPEENWEEEREFLKQILSGLAFALDIGIHHRDLKPGNILCQYIDDDTFYLKLCDFGIANKADSKSKEKTVSFIGTETYTPPYHEKDSKYPGARDVYSWAVIGIEVLAEKKLGSDDDVREALEVEVKPYYPVAVGKLLEKCIALDPSKRPRDAKKVLSEISKIDASLSRRTQQRVKKNA
ncbi:DUF5710 domain-containing protein [Rhodospirillales bacterium]|nr:DUF5710 domain-containing protein [Rhodospirillales bacterium]